MKNIGIKNLKKARRQRIHYRIRKKIKGTLARPRLVVYKSNTALYAQLVDDNKGHTILASDTRKLKGKSCSHAIKMGEELAQKLNEKKITTFVFDRSGYHYHGLVKALFDTVSQKTVKQ